MSAAMLAKYKSLAATSGFEEDPAQLALMSKFESLEEDLVADERASKKSALGWLFAKNKPLEKPKGLYIWGGVGRGKTMLMDLFYKESQVRHKKRIHFHAFMSDVHKQIHQYRQAQKKKTDPSDPIPIVADHICEELNLLCFDEFFITDIADAMILGRLFERFFDNGVIVVATSNIPPHLLYKDGLNRKLFLPFIQLLEQNTEIVELVSKKDFRREKLGKKQTYFSSVDAKARSAMDELFSELTDGLKSKIGVEKVDGHAIKLTEVSGHIARASFDALCNQPLGSRDYLHLTQKYQTIFVDDVPMFERENESAARRFINLVDTLYDAHTKLILSAAAEPDALYIDEKGRNKFAFERTASRLVEMRSEEYLNKAF